MRSGIEVGDILRGMGERLESMGLNTHQLRTLSAICSCRTAELGGHVDACTECGIIRVSYNSCRNRHCPKCQGNKREEWIAARNAELLPVPYFHVVFTLPDELNTFCLHHPDEAYSLLFRSAWQTLRQFGKEKQIKVGMISVLHTWGQTLSLHPHLHCIVPGGGTDKAGVWHSVRTNSKFLFPVKALSAVFRAKYVSLLRKTSKLSQSEIEPLFKQSWVVYAKRPFSHPSHVVEYLGRYTHKVALSNERLTGYASNRVEFAYKDYRKGGCKKEMELEDREFVRRYAMHILPEGFVRIRHYGLLSSTCKKTSLPQIREQFRKQGIESIEFIDLRKVRPYDPVVCPCCGTRTMVTIEFVFKRGPPPAHQPVTQPGIITAVPIIHAT